MKFSGIQSIDELLKKATVTVLLEKIQFVKNGSYSISPVQCPAISDGVDGPLFNEDKKVMCVLNGSECPYFETAVFDIHGYIKEIQCKVR